MARVVYVDYEEAQKLIPFFKLAKTHGPYKEARMSAGRILKELGNVRQVDYAPLEGYQLFLSSEDYEFFIDTLGAMEVRYELYHFRLGFYYSQHLLLFVFLFLIALIPFPLRSSGKKVDRRLQLLSPSYPVSL